MNSRMPALGKRQAPPQPLARMLKITSTTRRVGGAAKPHDNAWIPELDPRPARRERFKMGGPRPMWPSELFQCEPEAAAPSASSR